MVGYRQAALETCSVPSSRHLVRRSERKAHLIAGVGGLVVVSVAYPVVSVSRYARLEMSWIVLASWCALVVAVTWYDDHVLKSAACYFVASLSFFCGIYGGWHALDPPVRFRFSECVSVSLISIAPASGLYFLWRWFVAKSLGQLRQFLEDGQCMRCGYSLIGLEGRYCPECGWGMRPDQG